MEEQAALIALLRERPSGLTWAQITDAVLERGGASQARHALVADALFEDDEYGNRLAVARSDLADWSQRGYQFWHILDERYPARVRDIHEAPPFLFAQGARVDNDLAVSVVGSRKASASGLRMATAISELLVSKGITVVAGLAAGIDTAAHRAALTAGGRTVAVVGTGLNRSYPSANTALQNRIAEDGLVLSQFWPDAPPQQHNFPMRNAVMSGYGVATIVVEAGEHSGSRIQARMAVNHGRPVILTDAVVNQNTWAKELRDRPGVYVVSSTDEVSAQVDTLAQGPAQLSEALSQIAI